MNILLEIDGLIKVLEHDGHFLAATEVREAAGCLTGLTDAWGDMLKALDVVHSDLIGNWAPAKISSLSKLIEEVNQLIKG